MGKAQIDPADWESTPCPSTAASVGRAAGLVVFVLIVFAVVVFLVVGSLAVYAWTGFE